MPPVGKTPSEKGNRAQKGCDVPARPQPKRALSPAAKARAHAIDFDLAARRHAQALSSASLSRMIRAFRQALSENPRDLNAAFSRAQAVRHRRGAPTGNTNRLIHGRGA